MPAVELWKINAIEHARTMLRNGLNRNIKESAQGDGRGHNLALTEFNR